MRAIATTLSLFVLAAGVLVGCGATQTSPTPYPGQISVNDVVGFTVALAGQVDTQTPGPLPAAAVLAQLVDAYNRSPIEDFAPKAPGDLVAVALWLGNGKVMEILAGAGYPGNHALVDTIDSSRGTSVRSQVSSAELLKVIKGLARDRLPAEAKRQLDPGGTWLGG